MPCLFLGDPLDTTELSPSDGPSFSALALELIKHTQALSDSAKEHLVFYGTTNIYLFFRLFQACILFLLFLTHLVVERKVCKASNFWY